MENDPAITTWAHVADADIPCSSHLVSIIDNTSASVLHKVKPFTVTCPDCI